MAENNQNQMKGFLPSWNQSRPRTRTVSPGAQSGNSGSECKQGQAGFPQTRWQRSHEVRIQRLPAWERTAATGFFRILFSAVCALNSGVHLSRSASADP